MQPLRVFKVLVTASTIFLPRFFSLLLSSSDNGQFSILMQHFGDGDEVQEVLKYSSDFGKTWNNNMMDKFSTCENGNWTSLSMSSSGEGFLAARGCTSNDTTNATAILDVGWIVVIGVSSFDNNSVKSWSQKSNFPVDSTGIQTLAASEAKDYMYISNGYDIFKSSDYGVSWEVSLDLRRQTEAKPYVVIKTSDSGQYSYALLHYSSMDAENDLDDGMGYTYSSVLYMSADFGNSWDVVVQSLTTSKGVNSLWVSNDGQYVMFSSGTNMVLYSRDYGKSFENLLPRSNAVFANSAKTNDTTSNDANKNYLLLKRIFCITAITMSHNGHHIVLAAKSVTLENMLLTSRDGGHWWSKHPAPISDLRHMTVDNEGERIIGVLQDGTITTIALATDSLSSSTVTYLRRRQPE